MVPEDPFPLEPPGPLGGRKGRLRTREYEKHMLARSSPAAERQPRSCRPALPSVRAGPPCPVRPLPARQPHVRGLRPLSISRIIGLSQQDLGWGDQTRGHEPLGVCPLFPAPLPDSGPQAAVPDGSVVSAGRALSCASLCPPPGHPPPVKGQNVPPGAPQSGSWDPRPCARTLGCQGLLSVGHMCLQITHVVVSTWRIWGSKALKYLRN